MKRILFFAFLSVLSHTTFAQQSKIDSLKKILVTSKEDTTKVNLLNDLIWATFDTNKDTALIYGKRAINLSQKIKFNRGIALSYKNTGLIYGSMDNDPEELKCYFASLKIMEEIGEKKGIANCYALIGRLYSVRNNFSEARKNYFSALKIRTQLRDLQTIVGINAEIGSSYENEAEFLRKQNANSDSINKKLIAAMYIYSDNLKMQQQMGNNKGIADTHNAIGRIYTLQKNYSEGLKNLIYALQASESCKDTDGIAFSHLAIGNTYSEQGDYNKALENYFIALKIWEGFGDTWNAPETYIKIGNIYLKQHQAKEAIANFEKGLSIAKIDGSNYLMKELYGGLVKAYEISGINYEKLYESYKRYIIYRDTLINEAKTKQIVKQEMNYEYEKKEAVQKAEQDKKDAVAAEQSRRERVIKYSVIGGLMLMFIISVIIFRSLRVTRKQKQIIEVQKTEVEKSKHIIEEKNKDITDSINYAQRIQRALLASESLLNKNLGEYFVFFKPKDIVSGDFYWATEKDGRFYLAVCDSTGHGVPGAFMSLLNISFLNEAIAEKGIKQPNDIFNHVRQRLIENISTDGAKDGMDGILVCFDRNTKSVSYAGANNAPYLMNGSLQELTTDNMPVGLGEKKDCFTNNTISFQAGNILYLYTDGFADQFGGPKGKKFKYKPLNEKLLAISHQPLAKQKEELEKTFAEWKGNLEQVDDVLVIGVRL